MLYNWYAVNTGKLAPAGWHVATKAEWDALYDYLGSDAVEKMQAPGFPGWSPEPGLVAESGFRALPTGNRSTDGTWYSLGSEGYWWTSSAGTVPGNGKAVILSAWRGDAQSAHGLCVRCVKD